MEANRLNCHFMEWALASKCDNVDRKCMQMFEAIDMNYILDLERQFSKLHVTQVRDKLMSNFVNEWQVTLNREEAKTGPGKNKLHTC